MNSDWRRWKTEAMSRNGPDAGRIVALCTALEGDLCPMGRALHKNVKNKGDES